MTLRRWLIATALPMLFACSSAAQSPSLVGLPQASDPTCNAGEYYLAVRSGTTKWTKCENGVWTEMGLTSGSGDDLGSHIATTDLDLDNNELTNVGIARFEDLITQFPAVETTTALSPTHVKTYDLKNWFNIDGEKFNIEGDCVDLYNDVSAPQTTGAPDGLCDINRYTAGSHHKTKTVGHEQEYVNLSESEGYAHWINAFAGGDTDLVGININAYATGGAHASGDEGLSLYRGFAQDYYLRAVGTISAGLTAGAGTQTVTITGGTLTEDESQMVGENKLAVFTGSNYTVTVSDAPPGTINGGVLEDSGTAWLNDGSASGQGVWTLGAGQVTASNVKAGSWCFSAVDSDYTDVNGNASQVWLLISAIDTGADTITTRWENQGFNAKTPYPYLSGEGASEGRVAPCAPLGPPTFSGGIGDYVADSLTFVKGDDFPAQSSGATFEVHAYPNIRLNGVRLNASNKLGGMYSFDGFGWNSLLDASANSGRFMLGAAFTAGYDGSLSNLLDGEHHAHKYGLDCAQSPGACKFGLAYRYSPDPTDIEFDGFPVQLVFSGEDWTTDDRPMTVIAPYVTSAHQTASDLTVDPTDGWGQAGTPFAKTTGAKTTDNCAKWDSSGRVVDAGVTCGGGGGGGTGDITAVGPGYSTGDAFVDGAASTGTEMLVWEGPTIDGFEFKVIAPLADPVADINITFPGSSATLATLALAETFTNKTLTTPVLSLTQSAAPAPTAEGRVEWETDDDHIIMGNGASSSEFVPTEDVSGDATMTTAGVVEVTQADALETNGANCSVGEYARGVDASGVAENCAVDDDVPDAGEVGDTALAASAVDGGSGGEIQDGTIDANDIAAGGLTAADAAADLATQAELDAKSAASSTDNAVARFDSTSGDVQNSGVIVDDLNNVDMPGDLTTGSGGTTDPTYFMFRDTDDNGYTECGALNGVFSCGIDADGVIDGTL